MKRGKKLDPLKLALPKGKLLDNVVAILGRMGIRFTSEEGSARLRVPSDCGRYEVLKVRAADVPAYVAHGAADLGVVGRDVLWENAECEEDIYDILDLGFGRCRLAVASVEGRVPDSPVWRVATKYPVSAAAAFQKSGRPVELVKLYGSVELAPLTGIADVIVDLVETGRTLKANNLEVIEELGVSTARLIANRVSYKARSRETREFVSRIRELL